MTSTSTRGLFPSSRRGGDRHAVGRWTAAADNSSATLDVVAGIAALIAGAGAVLGALATRQLAARQEARARELGLACRRPPGRVGRPFVSAVAREHQPVSVREGGRHARASTVPPRGAARSHRSPASPSWSPTRASSRWSSPSPAGALEEAGAVTELLAPKGGTVQAFNHLDRADSFDVQAPVSSVGVGDFDGAVLPGGVANADALRLDPDAAAFVGELVRQGKPLGVICHGPWVMIEADVVRGRTMTSWPSLQTDLRNAGATWVDEQVVTCSKGPGVIVSSRKPDDLPAFCDELVGQLAARGRART